MATTLESLENIVDALKDELAETQASVNGYLTCDVGNNFFLLMVGAMVFMMQMGFAMLEYSAVHPYHGATVLLKNLCDVCIAAITWWLLGNGLTNGNSIGGIFGGAGDKTTDGTTTNTAALFYSVGEEVDSNGMLTGQAGYAGWFFGFAFAATAATIVSGAVAERTKFVAYFIYSIILTAIVYPVVAHWVWNGDGFLAAHVIDFAGSGVVHMTGGVAALWGAAIVGPRKFIKTTEGYKPRFDDNLVNDHKYVRRGLPFGVLGTIVLWFGWYAFNPGSVLGLCSSDGSNTSDIMGTAIATTTLSPASAAITGVIYTLVYNKVRGINEGPDPAFICNCILAGLVGITSGTATLENFAAMITGVVSAFVYMGSSWLLKRLKIDDVIDAFPVHGACGAWGCIATGLFTSTDLLAVSYGDNRGSGLFYDPSKLIGYQILLVIAVFLWVSVVMVPVFLALKYTGVLRLDEEVERVGHGPGDEEAIVSNKLGEFEMSTEAATSATGSDSSEYSDGEDGDGKVTL